jgi:phosphatidylglycerol:prolipoprotein diacylglycerol transferase
MLPILFQIVVPAGWGLPVAALLAVVFVAGRAHFQRRHAAGEGEKLSWGQALWDDKAVLAVVVAGLAMAWRGGLLSRRIELPLHSYGLMLALAFVVGIWLAQREAARQGQSPQAIADVSFWILVSALVGSRVFFILVNWGDYFGANALVDTPFGRIPRLLAVWEGGLVFYGGFIAAAITSVWYLRAKRIPWRPYADTLLPSVAFGQFLGRIGCFGAGCCWGRTCDPHLPWAAHFPPESLAFQSFAHRANPAQYLDAGRLHTVGLHPVQLYESLGELALFAVLVLVVRPRKRFHGQVMATWLVLYAILRTVTETFRGDVERGVYLGLGAGQWVSLLILAAGVLVWVTSARRTRRAVAALPPLV